MKRIADVSIDTDGDEFVLRVRPGDALRDRLAFFLGPKICAPVDRVDQQHATLPDANAKKEAAAAAPSNVTAEGRSRRRRGPPPALSDQHDAEIRRRFVNQSPAEIAQALGLPNWQVEKRCAALGLRRSPSDAAKLRWQRRRADQKANATNATGPCEGATRADLPRNSEVEPKPDRPAQTAKAVDPPKPLRDQSKEERARERGERNAEMKRLYAEEELSSAQIGEIYGLDPKTVRNILKADGVPMRTASQAQRVRSPPPPPMKLRPSEIPADAPRQRVKLADIRAAEREERANDRPGDGVRRLREEGRRITRQKLSGMAGEPLTSDSVAAAVERYVAGGGKITEIETAKIEQAKRPAVGMSGSRSGGRLGDL